MVKTELKERPQVILPCPRCINGQILAINDWVCFQCGFDLSEAEEQFKMLLIEAMEGESARSI